MEKSLRARVLQRLAPRTVSPLGHFILDKDNIHTCKGVILSSIFGSVGKTHSWNFWEEQEEEL